LTDVYDKATYQEMIEEVVLRPLGLVATTSGGETQAAGHAFRRRPAPNWHLDWLAGGRRTTLDGSRSAGLSARSWNLTALRWPRRSV
jgi:hypothetical protein